MTIVLHSCGGGKTIKVEEEAPADTTTLENDTVESEEELIADSPMPMAADELFDDFIFNFAANSKLQKERIQFPLTEHIYDQTKTLKSSQWQMEYFFMRQGYYTLMFNSRQESELVKDTTISEAIVEKICLDDDYVKQYRFRRIRGRWMLCDVVQQKLSENANATFLTFYQRFVTDSVFQMQSLASQIEFVGPDPDDDFSQMEGIIMPEYWGVFAPELPSGQLYNIVYGPQRKETNEKIFIFRGIANGFEVEVSFSKKSGHWKLVKLIT